MDLLEDEAAAAAQAGVEYFDLSADVVADCRPAWPCERTKRVSQPPPQNVSRSPKSRFSSAGVHARHR